MKYEEDVHPDQLPAPTRRVSEVGSCVNDISVCAQSPDPFPAAGQARLPQVPNRPVRSGTAILGRYNDHIHHDHPDNAHQDRLDPHGAGHQGPHHGSHFHGVAEVLHLDHAHVDQRTADALQQAKSRHLATPGMIEHITAVPGVNPYAISELPIGIQAGFRKKMLLILFLQLFFSVALGFGIRYIPALEEPLLWAFPPQGTSSLVLLAAMLLGVPCMSCIKDKHPFNLIFTFAWSVLLGLFLAASDQPGAYSRAHAFLIIMSMLTTGIFFLVLFSQLRTRDVEGNPALWSFTMSGLCSWVCWLIVSICIFTQVRGKVDWGEPPAEDDEIYNPTPIFVTASIVSTVIYVWFCYEAYKLCCKMQPDEYMKGVIYFYTDMFYVCACCALLACLGGGGGGGGGGGAPPRDEEER